MDMGSRKDMMGENPWPGLSSYPDPDKSDVQLRFCGRDNDIYDVASLIDNNIFVTLYGKSGTGKTSLLKAGVFPRLRKSNYLPVIVRLGVDAKDISFQDCILKTISQAMAEVGIVQKINLMLHDYGQGSQEYLWKYFATTRFLNFEGQVLFPVIVLDQFEEVLRSRRTDVAVLLRQIYFLMDETHALSDREINGRPYTYDFNFRFIVTIREDELYRLEDCIDEDYLANMKHCRYRLRNLSADGIRDAILIPGGDLFLENEREEIVGTINEVLNRYRENGGANTIILSLVCSLLFNEAKRAGMSHITLDHVRRFVKRNPIKKFYRKVTKKLYDRERSYIENNLVDSLGRRDSVPLEDFYQHVRKDECKKLFEGDKRILQTASSSSGSVRVELIHDILAEYLKPLKKKRQWARKIKHWISSLALLFVFAVAGLYLISLSIDLEEEKTKRMELEDKLSGLEGDSDSISELIDSIFSAESISQIKPGSYVVDDIVYDTISPSKSYILEWKMKYSDICAQKIEQKVKNYRVPKDMIEKEPCLVYLVLTSQSIDNSDDGVKERQSWFDLYSLMSSNQVYKLYDILYREHYKLAQIEAKYKDRQDSISKKYSK